MDTSFSAVNPNIAAIPILYSPHTTPHNAKFLLKKREVNPKSAHLCKDGSNSVYVVSKLCKDRSSSVCVAIVNYARMEVTVYVLLW